MSRDDDRAGTADCAMLCSLPFGCFLAPSSFPQMVLESFASVPLEATHQLPNLVGMFFSTLLPFKPSTSTSFCYDVWISVARLADFLSWQQIKTFTILKVFRNSGRI